METTADTHRSRPQDPESTPEYTPPCTTCQPADGYPYVPHCPDCGQTTPPRPHVALDLDGTLYDFDGHVRTLYRHHHWNQPAATILPSRARQYLDTRDDTHFDTMGQLLQWFTDMQGWYNEPAFPNALTAVFALQRLPIDLHLVTSRPAHASHQTRCAITRDHGPDQVVVITQQPKYCLGYDLYIDDAPEQIEGYIAHGCDYLIYDQPWNQGLPGRRVYDPLDIYKAVRHWALPHAEPNNTLIDLWA